MNPDADLAIADFARLILGCQCEPEVFRSIELDTGQVAGLAYARVVIGARLLIWLARRAGAAQAAELARHGLSDRDAHGYNRFRLVLAETDAGTEVGFRAAVGGDAKAHLHAVPEAAWPAPVRAVLSQSRRRSTRMAEGAKPKRS